MIVDDFESVLCAQEYQGNIGEVEFASARQNSDYYPIGCYDDCQEWSLWPFSDYFFLNYTGGDGLGYRKGYGSAGVFITPTVFDDSRFVTFADVRGYLFTEGRGAANAGVGFRYMLDSWNGVAGINLFYDHRNFEGYNFNQIGVGVEFLSECFDIRINGYFPVGSYNYRKGRLFEFGDDYRAARFKWYQAYRGVDGEIGVWFLKKQPCCGFGLYFAIGPYFYERDKQRKETNSSDRYIRGGKARLIARVHDYVDVSVNGTYDNHFHGRVNGQITVTLPLFECLTGNLCSCRPLPCLDRQIATQPVGRNGIIVADSTDCSWLWNWSGGCCEPCYDNCPSGCYDGSGSYRTCSWHSSEFCSGFFPYP
jgi:hypothetical protein